MSVKFSLIGTILGALLITTPSFSAEIPDSQKITCSVQREIFDILLLIPKKTGTIVPRNYSKLFGELYNVKIRSIEERLLTAEFKVGEQEGYFNLGKNRDFTVKVGNNYLKEGSCETQMTWN